MSWFDATGFANLAMTALKEAQKTIDKALDIKDEDQKSLQSNKEDTSDFFASWGLKKEEDVHHHNKRKDSKQETTNSIWGSFTGSFFESPKFNEDKCDGQSATYSKSLQSTPTESDKTEMQKLASSSSFSEDYKGNELTVNTSKITKDHKDNTTNDKIQNVSNQDIASSVVSNASMQLVLSNTNTLADTAPHNDYESVDCSSNRGEKFQSDVMECYLDEKNTFLETNQNEGSQNRKKETIEHVSISESSSSNKLSFLSPESDKNSLESVEILGSQSNTDCITTPESDGSSLSNLASPSTTGTEVKSESVEVLPDSLVTSPTSVKILGDWKNDGSPYISPTDPTQFESSSELETDDLVTPCWEDINVAQIINKETQETPSSSDISPYESPIEEVKTPHNNLCTELLDNISTMEVCLEVAPLSNRTVLTGRITTDNTSSTENLEVTQDTNDPDEMSLADDSCTSVSENTVMTISETFQQKEQIKSKVEVPISVFSSGQMTDLCLDSKPIMKKEDIDAPLKLDSLNLHLPIEAITTQPIRKPEHFEGNGKMVETDPNSFNQLINATIEPTESEQYSVKEELHTLKSDTLEVVDQHLVSTDSSCEGTLVESSSEDNPQLIHKSEEKLVEVPLSASSYMKTMLADAMIEKGESMETEGQGVDVPRENSPISSESRSDLVKIGSDQTSGHTSGDELETTTSSDIEIISSPNGDSSSTHSRQSLAKLQLTKGGDLLTKTLKTRGHSRELSEISIGSDDANVEIEKLLKRVQEMTEILEARESKLIDVSRMNMELQEQNNSLKKQLDNFEKHAEQSQNLNQITDEYTQRLSALERKFQQAIRERDSLRKNLEQLKVESATRLSSQEMVTLNAEKDEIIKELREEGEKLSKQQLQHSNIIKKLRVKEKENDTLIKSQKEQIEQQTLELERLKRSLHAKEEVERSQIEAVHTLTAKTKKQEKEILTLQEKLDSALHKIDAYKTSLDAAKVDLSETKKILAATEMELKDVANSARESCQLLAQIEEMKIKLRESEEMHVKKEEFLKHENSELLKRLEAAEARSEELSESVSMATKPLLRQLEQLQANLLHKSNGFMKQEKVLLDKNIELQTKVETLIETDRYLKEENVNLKSKISQLESKLTTKENEKSQLQEVYDELMNQKEKLTEENVRLQQTIETLKQSHASHISDLNREISALENKLAVEKAATDAEKRKNHALSKQKQNIEDREPFGSTTSMEQDTVNVVDSIWPLQDSRSEDSSQTYTIAFDNIRTGSGNTSIFETLQAQLKQKDGEIQQLQWELSRRNVERDALNTELSTLTLKIEELNAKVADVTVLNENLHEIQTRYDALLQMYGEKMEENQELRLDLEDIKEMYKTQIDQLLKRDA